jgi:hypothetical protein
MLMIFENGGLAFKLFIAVLINQASQFVLSSHSFAPWTPPKREFFLNSN